MHKIMYNRAPFILHRKRRTLTFSRRHKKEVIDSNSKKSFRGLENAEIPCHCTCYVLSFFPPY